jgi:hypothetical protein
MSRQNKVNPGMYTQRGRLTQDDAARELARQRSVGAPRSWEQDRQGKLPRLKGSEPTVREAAEEPKSAKRAARKRAPVKAKAKAAKKTVKAAKKAKSPARKRTTTRARG